MKKVPNQSWTSLELDAKPMATLWLFGTRNGFWCSDLKAKLYRKKCSMPAFQNSCRRAGKTDKTLANVLIVLGSCPRRRWPIPNLQRLWLCYRLRAPRAKRKIKKRELTFKHISDAWWNHRGEGFRSWSKPGFSKLNSSTKRFKRLDMAWQCLAQLKSVCQVNGLLKLPSWLRHKLISCCLSRNLTAALTLSKPIVLRINRLIKSSQTTKMCAFHLISWHLRILEALLSAKNA